MVAHARLTNSSRLDRLLAVATPISQYRTPLALAPENNLDIAVQGYGPFLSA
jgi:hypothetical protein